MNAHVDPARGMIQAVRKSLLGLCLLFPSLLFVIACWRWSRLRIWGRPAVAAASGASRSLGADAREKRPQRPRQHVETELTVPEAVVGYLIGRGGNRIRQVEEESGARIRFKERIGTKDKVGGT